MKPGVACDPSKFYRDGGSCRGEIYSRGSSFVPGSQDVGRARLRRTDASVRRRHCCRRRTHNAQIHRRTVTMSKPIDKFLASKLRNVANTSFQGLRELSPTMMHAFGIADDSPSAINGITTACLTSEGHPRWMKPLLRPARSAMNTGLRDDSASSNGHELDPSPVVFDDVVPENDAVDDVVSESCDGCEYELVSMRVVNSAGADG